MQLRARFASRADGRGLLRIGVATLVVLMGVGCQGSGSGSGPGNSTVSAARPVSVTTYHNDAARTGQNLEETALAPENVNSEQFGKLFSFAVDGQVYAQPLYLPNVTIPNRGSYNVVYVATEHDSVYALDADGKTSSPLWQVTFINPSVGITPEPSVDTETQHVVPEIGITGTPVIDPTADALYVVAKTKEVSGSTTSYVQRLHALDTATGAEKFGGPVVIAASVPGTGIANDGNGNVPFDPRYQYNRPGLLLSSGVLYAAFGAENPESANYHGWLFAYNARSLRQVGAFNTSPNGAAVGLWQCGGAPAADANGNIFVATGDGTYDADAGAEDYGDSVLKFTSATAGLPLADYFTPFNQAQLAMSDLDLGTSNPLVLPDQPTSTPHLLVQVGKQGTIYVLNRDNLGKYNSGSDSQIVQSFNSVGVGYANPSPAYWQDRLYFAAADDYLKLFRLSDGLIQHTLPSRSKTILGPSGAVPAISANGTQNGIVWLLETTAVASNGSVVLHAYDALDVSRELYNSTMAGTRDAAGPALKFTVPTIANGRVYVGTATEVDVYGLFPQ